MLSASLHSWLVGTVILLTLIGVAAGRVPGLRMNRATIALVGAVCLVALGALTLEEALAAIDLHTLALLLGMMLLNANLRLAGFFTVVGDWMISRQLEPRHLLATVMATAAVLSALVLNDTVVLMMTPLVVEVTLKAGLSPLPQLVGLAIAANLGSVATLVGNPQNMLIGVSSGIDFLAFSHALAPLAAGTVVLAWAVLTLVYRRELTVRDSPRLALPVEDHPPLDRLLLSKTLAAIGLLLLTLLAGVELALAALTAGAVLLVIQPIEPDRLFREIDTSLLVFFAGLFVVTAAFQQTGFGVAVLTSGRPLAEGGIASLTLLAAALSNLVSNVPAVMLLSPLVATFDRAETAWLTLAMATTLAGNLTLLGSVANLIVAESARTRGIRLGFWAYLRGGVPVTLLTLACGILWLAWR